MIIRILRILSILQIPYKNLSVSMSDWENPREYQLVQPVTWSNISVCVCVCVCFIGSFHWPRIVPCQNNFPKFLYSIISEVLPQQIFSLLCLKPKYENAKCSGNESQSVHFWAFVCPSILSLYLWQLVWFWRVPKSCYNFVLSFNVAANLAYVRIKSQIILRFLIESCLNINPVKVQTRLMPKTCPWLMWILDERRDESAELQEFLCG